MLKLFPFTFLRRTTLREELNETTLADERVLSNNRNFLYERWMFVLRRKNCRRGSKKDFISIK